MKKDSTLRTALIAYGSETGNSQDVAEEIGRLMERLRFNTRVAELDALQSKDLYDYQFTVFVVPTTGQGDFPANGRKFWRSLLLKRLPPTFLQGISFVLFGLGDSSYPKFNWASRKLYRRLLQLGADELYPRGEADEQHPEGLEGTFLPWSLDLRKHLLDKFPLEEGQHPIPDDVRLPSKWILDRHERTDEEDIVQQTRVPNAKLLSRAHEFRPLDHDTRPLPGSIPATLVANTRMTPPDHWQDVRHLVLTASEPISYAPGDILHITPRNFPQDVDRLIALMGWEEHADIPLQFVTGDGSPPCTSISAPSIPFLLCSPGFTLRALLTDYLDIMAIPRRSFFSQVAHFTNDEMHKERLLEFTNPEYIDEFYDYTTRPRRSILEVLTEFDTVKIPWQLACTVLPVLRGRQFSLASGGKLKTSPDGGTRFELLVAIVKYQTVIKRIRQGVCTRYLAVLQPGSTLKVQVQKGGLQSSTKQLSDPSVLIGPGTGVAPIRSLLWEKAAVAEEFRKLHGPDGPLPLGPVILLYGGRNRSADYFFEAEWEELKSQLSLTVITAFSRDQKKKFYVQDALREKSSDFYDLLHEKGGSVFVCGSSGRMPQAVREALIETFQAPLGDSAESRQTAERYLIDMEKTGRYRQETW
ncbi:NAPDH-dependent diflavin reductase [Microsporum audouinii]